MKRGVYIVGAKRTAFGTYGGRLRETCASKLGIAASKAALEQAGVAPEQVQTVICGNINNISSAGGIGFARAVSLGAGIPIKVPALMVNRLCGTGFQAVVNAAHEIQLNEVDIALAPAIESMSTMPYIMRDTRWGVRFPDVPKLSDGVWESLEDHFSKVKMGQTAENVAEKYNISREDSDKIAFRSQTRWKAAHDAGKFKDEIVPIVLKDRKGNETVFEVDEHPRPNTTMESLGKLPTVFKKNGTVTAGNASGISDGGAAILVASEDAVKKNNLKPLSRVVGYASVGVDPLIMGIGPIDAIRKLLELTGKSVKDIDFIEINEAFAPQFAACERELGLDPEKTNVNGGAIALGHPVGASGGRILANLTYELIRTGKKYAIGSACIGGGQGIAVLIERC